MTYEITRPVLWRGPVVNESGGMVRPVHGVILHIMDGNLWGTDSWFKNPQAQASSDYGTPRDGSVTPILSWVDWEHDWKAWAEGTGNPYWVSIENEGKTGDALSISQIEDNAQIVAHVFSKDNVPFKLAESPTEFGLGWHGMGGNAWGGHFSCPGDPIKAQRPAILHRAQQLVGAAPVSQEDPDMLTLQDKHNGEIHLVDAEGEVFDFTPVGTPGGFRLGALNTHPLWDAGKGHGNGPVIAAWLWDDPLTPHTGREGMVIVTRDLVGAFHNYNFKSDGSTG